MRITGRWHDKQIHGEYSQWFWSPFFTHKINYYNVGFRRFGKYLKALGIR